MPCPLLGSSTVVNGTLNKGGSGFYGVGTELNRVNVSNRFVAAGRS